MRSDQRLLLLGYDLILYIGKITIENNNWMDIIVFLLTEPGAIGIGGLFACITNKKEYAEYNYVNGDISYLELCQLFPIISKCVFNGAMPFDVKISKEFYYLGHMTASGNAKEFTMPNTTKTAVEIEWIIDVPVREDIYEYIVNA